MTNFFTSKSKPLGKLTSNMSSNASQLEKESHSTVALRDSQNSDQQESEPQYPGPLKLTLIIISLNLAMFLVGLDNTIISSAIPKITDQFHALDDVGWYASAYLLTNCAFQLIWGKLFTFYVVKRVYLTALFIFELGSLICAMAPSSTALIVGRAIAGVGGGGVGNGSFLLIAHCVPPRQRPAFIGMMGSMYGIASIAGPLMGGAFTDNISWRWCFYINLPLGVLPAVIITFFIAPFRGSKKGEVSFLNQLKQMDLPGTACLLPGVICLLLALQWGGSTYPWKNGRIIALFVLAGLLFIAFIVIQYISGDRATVPGRVFSNRNIWGSALFGSCVTAGFFLLLYYVSTKFQSNQPKAQTLLTHISDPNLATSRQRRQRNQIRNHESPHAPRQRHILPTRRRPHLHNRLLHALRLPHRDPDVHRQRTPLHLASRLRPRQMDRLPVPRRRGSGQRPADGICCPSMCATPRRHSDRYRRRHLHGKPLRRRLRLGRPERVLQPAEN